MKLNFIGNNISGAFPATSLLTVPISINIYGGISALMGVPEGFLSVQISGIEGYKIPYYQ